LSICSCCFRPYIMIHKGSRRYVISNSLPRQQAQTLSLVIDQFLQSRSQNPPKSRSSRRSAHAYQYISHNLPSGSSVQYPSISQPVYYQVPVPIDAHPSPELPPPLPY
jgi:hypothetical protein